MTMRGALLSLLLAGLFATVSRAAEDPGFQARMAAEHAADQPVPSPTATVEPRRRVTGTAVAYATVEGQSVTGYLAKPADAAGLLPGLIVIHEWWGLNDGVRAEAERLAGEGYVALAVDLYAGQVAEEPRAAMQLSMGLGKNPAPAEQNLRQAYRYLEEVERSPRIGTIGWCLGGRWSLRAALLLPEDIDATVIYYGSVQVPEEELARLRMPILGLFASRDRVVPLPTVEAFRDTMRRLGRPLEIKIYEGADHAFANPSGTAYDAAAAEDAWRLTTAFLDRELRAPQSGQAD